MEDIKHKAKLEAIKRMRDEASRMMKDGLGSSLKKVSVMAPDKAGIQEGLEKAKQILGHSEDSEDESKESPELENEEEMLGVEDESPEEQGLTSDEPESLEDIEKQIKELELKKAMLLKK